MVQTSLHKEAVNKGFAAEHLNFNVKTTCIHKVSILEREC